MAYSPRLLEGQFFSHTTAAALLDLRMPTGFMEDELHVTSVAPRRAPRGSGVIGHKVARSPEVWSSESGRMRASSPIDTWISLGRFLSLDNLVVMGDGLLSRRNPLATHDGLGVAVAEAGRARGVAELRRALPLLRPGTDSAPETILRLLLQGAGLPEPEVNGEIVTPTGRFHGDLVYRSSRVVIEYDGQHHRTDDRQFSIDVERLDMIMAARWRVLRVDKRLLARRAELIARVRSAIQDGLSST
ncbi:hypothetical protein [Naasia lichenicola]|uniref:DUF559 domain-containing protein n=1 Tax=Naasia lichenicola TaxID=2565933 RepID=A0A4S4FEZ1_9MICO|nr:hypothetical protein [Naasia lichenicola]THG28750.1 hypothetical protein E6C64_18410 [Naasia lichenicola]